MNAKKANKKIALQRIHRMFLLAHKVVQKEEKLAQNYVKIARRISMASRVRIPREYRWQVCRNCKGFVLPGINCSVRTQPRREPHLVITCGSCGRQMRHPLKNLHSGARNRGKKNFGSIEN